MDKSTGTPTFLEEKKALPNCSNCISTSVVTVLKCMKWLYPYVIGVWWWFFLTQGLHLVYHCYLSERGSFEYIWKRAGAWAPHPPSARALGCRQYRVVKILSDLHKSGLAIFSSFKFQTTTFPKTPATTVRHILRSDGRAPFSVSSRQFQLSPDGATLAPPGVPISLSLFLSLSLSLSPKHTHARMDDFTVPPGFPLWSRDLPYLTADFTSPLM